MKRPDINTLILPGFMQLVELPSGVPSLQLKDTLRVAQVAKMLKMDPSTVRLMCEDGTFEGAYRLTEREKSLWVIPRAPVEAYLEKRGLVVSGAKK